MAPANGSSKSRKAQAGTATATSASASTGKPAQKKTVVPALPLPYVKRQAAAIAVAAEQPVEARSATKIDGAVAVNEPKTKTDAGKGATATLPKEDGVAVPHQEQGMSLHPSQSTSTQLKLYNRSPFANAFICSK